MTAPQMLRPAGWYWVRKKGWGDNFEDWVPAEWRPAARAWYSTAFSGIPDAEMIVGERLDAPSATPKTPQAATADQGGPGVSFEVRQQVRTVNKRWLEVVSSGECERPIRMDYDRVVGENPDEYFELVRVERAESCLAFTPKLP